MTICLDFDGCMNLYKGYNGPDQLYLPAPGVEKFLKELNKRTDDLVIFTARDKNKVWEWLHKYGLEVYVNNVTNTKIPAILYIDDRAIKFNGNFQETIQEVKEFKVHWNDDHPFEAWKKEEETHGTFNSQTYLEDEDPNSPWELGINISFRDLIQIILMAYGAFSIFMSILVIIINFIPAAW